MGTSTSFRAPHTPRWDAFVFALQSRLPIERVQSELFNAGQDWREALGDQAIARLAESAARIGDDLPKRLEGADRVEQAFSDYARDARYEAEILGHTPAIAMGDRALRAVILRYAVGDLPASERTARNVAERVASTADDRGEMVVRFLGELLSQYSRHVTAREFGRLTEGEHGLDVREIRALTRQLADVAQQVGWDSPRPTSDVRRIRDEWADLVTDAFERGSTVPPRPM
jgi:hypothetical protein